MSLLNPGTFDFGLLLGVITFLDVTMSAVLCFLFRIRILEACFFTMPTYTYQRFNIDFKLGWIPGGAFIKPLGMTSEKKEQELIAHEHKPYAFFSKGIIQKLVLCYHGTTTVIVFLLITLLFTKPAGNSSFVSNLLIYLTEAFKTPFSGPEQKFAFSKLTHTMASQYDFFSFALLCYLITIVFHEFIINTGTFLGAFFKPSRIINVTHSLLANVPSLFLVIWGIALILSYNSVWRTILYLLNGLAGYYISIIALFFLQILLVKSISKLPEYQSKPIHSDIRSLE